MGLAEWKEVLRLTDPVANQHDLRSRWIFVSKEIALWMPPFLNAMRLKQLPMSLKETRCES